MDKSVFLQIGITYIRHRRLGDADWGGKKETLNLKARNKTKSKVLHPVPLPSEVRKKTCANCLTHPTQLNIRQTRTRS